MDGLDDGVFPGIGKVTVRKAGVYNVQQRNPDSVKAHFDEKDTKTVSTARLSNAHTADSSIQCFMIDCRDSEGTGANAR